MNKRYFVFPLQHVLRTSGIQNRNDLTCWVGQQALAAKNALEKKRADAYQQWAKSEAGQRVLKRQVGLHFCPAMACVDRTDAAACARPKLSRKAYVVASNILCEWIRNKLRGNALYATKLTVKSTGLLSVQTFLHMFLSA